MKYALKTTVAQLALSLWAGALFAADTNAPAIMPLPQQLELRAGAFQLSPDTEIFANHASLATARHLAARLRQSTGYPLKVALKFRANRPIANAILLTTKSTNTQLGAEGYELTVASNAVVIRAPEQAGLFYGGQTLLQLFPPEIYSASRVTNTPWQIPCLHIQDWPRFQWRGLMLDVSRHFYSKGEVETILDLMALHKLNRFHWHLADDQGWRIEIKKYPRLTQTGAWREQSDLKLPKQKGTNALPTWAAPAPAKFGPDGRYGGFYTRDDIREVVACAAARHITIVPEIEMPGHSVAALSAYPQFGGFGASNTTDSALGINGMDSPANHGVYNPANEGTFQFLDGVLAEVFKLFPGKYVHIGGDEVRKEYWKNSAECQALMKREGLKNPEELQSWFIKRIEKFVNSRGKTLIGWSEILQGGLAPSAIVMDWIGGGREAAGKGHDVVMSPTAFCYLDHYQSTNHSTEPRAIGGFLPLKKVYSFEPVPTNLPPQFQAHILGAQGNLWTEYVASLAHAEYMIFPRMCALAEVDWFGQEFAQLR